LQCLLDRSLPTVVCTIYEPRFPDPNYRRIATTGLTLLNDVILREAVSHRLPVVDLRLICDKDEDFANIIEPSAIGGGKIASAVAQVLNTFAFGVSRSEIFGVD